MELRIRIDEIRESVLPLDRELPLAFLASVLEGDPPTGFTATRDARLLGRLSLVRGDRDVVFEGDFPLQVKGACRRCLGEVSLEVPVRFLLTLVKREKLEPRLRQVADDSGEGEIAGSFTPEEAEQVVFEGQEIDLEPIVREQLLLALPMDALCKESCQGLCQVCGANQNEGACGCDTHVPDPRWAGLRNIKLDG